MASKKPAAKPAKKITAKMSPRERSPKKKAARKAKPSTVNRYAARKAKREAWSIKNPGMIPGALGKPARPVVTPDALLEKSTAQAKKLGLTDDIKISDEVKIVVKDVTSQLGDQLDTSRDHLTGDQLDPNSSSYVPPGKTA